MNLFRVENIADNNSVFISRKDKRFYDLLKIRKSGIEGKIKLKKNVYLTYEPITETGLIISEDSQYPVNITAVYRDSISTFTIPPSWVHLSEKDLKVVSIENGVEFNFFGDLLKESLPATVVGLQRIQHLTNQRLFSSQLEKYSLPNTKFLFMESITDAFKIRRGYWGFGFRFSNAAYVNQFTPSKNGKRSLFIVEVILGESFNSWKTGFEWKQPPFKENSFQCYDSVKGFIHNHLIYTVYNKANFIPRYIISYN